MRLSILITAILVALGTAAPQHSSCNGASLSGLLGTVFPTTVESSPNPIATLYPQNVTGTINGTIAVVPIPYAEARCIIPSEYAILTTQYESILPGFPAGYYPLIVRSILDHDIIYDGLNLIADFQVCPPLQSHGGSTYLSTVCPHLLSFRGFAWRWLLWFRIRETHSHDCNKPPCSRRRCLVWRICLPVHFHPTK